MKMRSTKCLFITSLQQFCSSLNEIHLKLFFRTLYMSLVMVIPHLGALDLFYVIGREKTTPATQSTFPP